MTSNIAEALNAANASARERPVTTLLECLRSQMQEWTYNNREEALKCTTKLTPSSEQKLINNYVHSLKFTVRHTYTNITLILKSFFSVVYILFNSCCLHHSIPATQASKQMKNCTGEASKSKPISSDR